jgi:multiple antibiotic resistance protein
LSGVHDVVWSALPIASSIATHVSHSGFHTKLFTEVFVTLLVIMDPVGTVPLFLALTSGRSRKARNSQAWQAVVVAISVIAAFAMFGQQILRYLGISVAALQGAGGLLLVLVALELLTGKQTRDTEVPDVNVAFVPLGTPLLAGPGAIVATIVFVRGAHGAGDAWAIVAGIVAVHVVLYLSLRFSGVILRVIRDAGVSLITRISGLLLSAIAVQLIADSVIAFAKIASAQS